MNSTTLNDFEIMAPVGSRESLAAAIQAERLMVEGNTQRISIPATVAVIFSIFSDLHKYLHFSGTLK